jgi:hypothetical protein
VTAPPAVLGPLRKALVADAEGFHAPEGYPGAPGKARGSGAAGGLRPWQVGREAHQTWGSPRSAGGKATTAGWDPALEARQGNPGHGTLLEPGHGGCTQARQAAPSGQRGGPRAAPGVSSHAEYSEAGERPSHGAGHDGRTEPAQDTAAGPRRSGPPAAPRPAGESPQSAHRPAAPLSGAGRRPGCRAGPRRRAGPAQAGRQGRGGPHRASLRGQSAGRHRGMGPVSQTAPLPGHTGPARVQTAGKRRRKATRAACPRRPIGATGRCEATAGHRYAGVAGVP